MYVDGASITYDTASPKHIWTYATGSGEELTDESSCPCNTGSIAQVPPYVGSDYYCETGNNASGIAVDTFLPDDPLWDGQQCPGVEAPRGGATSLRIRFLNTPNNEQDGCGMYGM